MARDSCEPDMKAGPNSLHCRLLRIPGVRRDGDVVVDDGLGGGGEVSHDAHAHDIPVPPYAGDRDHLEALQKVSDDVHNVQFHHRWTAVLVAVRALALFLVFSSA